MSNQKKTVAEGGVTMSNQKKVVAVSDLSEWRKEVEHLPPWRTIELLDPQRVALVVVDTQYCCAGRHSVAGDFLRDHFPQVYKTYFDRIEQVMIPSIRRLITHFREHKRQIIYLTVSSHLPDGRDFHPLWRLREEQFKSEFGTKSYMTDRDSRDARILEELAPQPGDLTLNKVSGSAFNSTGFDQILRNMEITSLVFSGVVTNGCVYATGLDAADRGYKVVMVEDACAAVSDVLHYASLMIFHYGIGRVLNATDAIAELQASKAVMARQTVPLVESRRGT
jgi:nicotinamidase-related amidase